MLYSVIIYHIIQIQCVNQGSTNLLGQDKMCTFMFVQANLFTHLVKLTCYRLRFLT